MQKFGLRRLHAVIRVRQHPVSCLPQAGCAKKQVTTCKSAEYSMCAPCSKEIDVSRLESCNSCTGSGIKSGTSASTCGTCGGSGQVVQAVRTPLGVFQQARP